MFAEDPQELFFVLIGVALVMLVVDYVFGMIPVCIRFKDANMKHKISVIQCICGGFLLGSVIQMLWESHLMMAQIYGNYPGAFVIFALGLLFMMFFEQWGHIIIYEYREQLHVDPLDISHQYVEKKTTIRVKDAAAFILVVIAVVENYISSLATGMQMSIRTLLNLAMMILSNEWIQMFTFIFQYRKSRSEGIDSTEIPGNSNSKLFTNIEAMGYMETSEHKDLNHECSLIVGIVSLSNTFGLFSGYVISHTALGNNMQLQNVVSAVCMSFASGVFFYIAIIDMIHKELKEKRMTELTLIKKGCLIVFGMLFSCLINFLFYYYAF